MLQRNGTFIKISVIRPVPIKMTSPYAMNHTYNNYTIEQFEYSVMINGICLNIFPYYVMLFDKICIIKRLPREVPGVKENLLNDLLPLKAFE